MRVVITGGAGYLGQCLAKRLLQRGALRTSLGAQTPIKELVLADVVEARDYVSRGVECRVAVGDVADAAFCEDVVGRGDGPVSIFHLGAVMSGAGEADFDLCVGANLLGTLHLLEAARGLGNRPTFVYASAGATVGAGSPTDWIGADGVVDDSCRATPHTTYGMTKACGELLLADYDRRSFVDGRGARLPTVAVRAGAPNAATTSVYSGVVRESLAGKPTVSPIAGDVPHAIASSRSVIASLVALHDASPEAADAVLGYDRTVFLPAAVATIDGLAAATRDAVTAESRGRLGAVSFDVDAALSAAVGSFPRRVDASRALALGLPPAASPAQIVREYLEDFPDALADGVEAAAPPPSPADAFGDRAVALVTGGGSGIGRAVAVRLAKGGWAEGRSVAVVVVGRNRERLEETVKLCGPDAVAVARTCDVTSEAEVAELFGALPRVDVAFNNAGVNHAPTAFEDTPFDAWRTVLATNVDGAFLVAREAFRKMKKGGGGRIINNGSVSARTPRPGAAAYTASKHAVSGLTKAIALDGRDHDVACGEIHYGNVASSLTDAMVAGMPQADGAIRPEPRMGVDDAAEAVFYMASLPLTANVLSMTVMATKMPLVGRG